MADNPALRRGDFTLASGKKASYYLDCRNITLHPKGANVIAAGMLEVIQSAGPLPDAVGDYVGPSSLPASIDPGTRRQREALGYLGSK